MDECFSVCFFSYRKQTDKNEVEAPSISVMIFLRTLIFVAFPRVCRPSLLRTQKGSWSPSLVEATGACKCLQINARAAQVKRHIV